MKEQTIFTNEFQGKGEYWVAILKSLLETGMAHGLLLFAKRGEDGLTDQERNAAEEMEKHNRFQVPEVTRPMTI